jgi:hypothetical protein
MMRPLFLALPMFFAAAPALATGGFDCRTAGEENIRLAIVTGHGVAPTVAQVRLFDGRRQFSTAGEGEPIAVAQSWLDDDGLKLDLVDAQAQNYVARLRLSFVARGSDPVGDLHYGDRRYRVSCTGEQ